MSRKQDDRKAGQRERRTRVLIAEPKDDPTLSNRERWERQGLEAVVAHDAVEALERFRDQAPGLVVLDDRLPGFELSGLVRILHATSSRTAVPVILLSRSEDAEAAANDIGADGFLIALEVEGRLPEAIEGALAMTRANRK